MVEKTDEIGVGALVEYHEAGVRGEPHPFDREIDGVRVPAEGRLRFEDVHLMMARQQPRSRHAGDPRSDHAYAHLGPPLSRRPWYQPCCVQCRPLPGSVWVTAPLIGYARSDPCGKVED